MNLQQRFFALLSFALVLLTAATEASAITISRVRGGALLGRPLDVSVQVQYAPDEDATDACYLAHIQFGEVVLPQGQVIVAAEPLAQTRAVQLRITTTKVLDEPTLSINLSVGCKQKISRTFYLLADVLSDVSDSQTGVVGAPKASLSLGPAEGLSKVAAEPVATAVPGTPRAKVQREKKRKAKADTSPSAQNFRPVTSPRAQAAANNAGGGRVEFQIEALEKRLDSVWQQKIEETQQSTAEHAAKLKALDADLKGLQLLTAKNQKNVELLAQAIEKSQGSSSLTGLVYGLIAAMLAVLGGAAYYFWNAQRANAQHKRWWNTSEDSTELMASESGKPFNRVTEPSETDLAGQTQPGKPSGGAASAAVAEEEDIDLAIDLDALESQAIATRSAPLAAPPEQPERSEKRDFAHSTASAMRAINTKEMLDIRQQAEFFMALGQHDEAIHLLQHNINDNEQTNPLVYLDLLKVLHTLGRKQEFDQYAAEFNLQFTGRVPEFSDFDRQGNGLDAYADICSQIVQLWPTDDTIVFIEHCLVRTPDDDPESGFELEAFRDLLMLHGVLRRLDSMSASSMVPFSATRNPNSEMGALPVTTSNFTGPAARLGTVGADHEHLDLSEILPDLALPASTDLELPIEAAGLPMPSIAPSAYADLDLGGKGGNLIDFDISGLDALDPKATKK